MSPLLLAGVLAVAGGVLGHRSAAVLGTGGYRIEEDEAAGPAGAAWWPTPVLMVIWGVLGYRLGEVAGGAALPAYLLLGWLGVCLTWIDLDVHRLPNGLVLPAYPALAALLGVASLAEGEQHWRTALTGGAAAWLVFWVLSRLPGGGLGAGDVKVAGLLGLALGWLSLGHVVLGLLLAFVLGGAGSLVLLLARRVGLRSGVAFGPSLCLAAVVVAAAGPDLFSPVVTG